MIRGLILGGMLLIPSLAHAGDTPRAGAADARMRTVDYNPRQVYRVTGVFRTATQILFGDGEEILHVALGDTVAWEVAPAANILFLKPREKAGPTNLIVTTKQGGIVRNYQFELSARYGSIGSGTRDTMFQVKFRYPAEERAAAAAARAQRMLLQAAVIEGTAVKFALDAAVLEGPRNLRYSLKGDGDLQPSEVTDNGQFTVLRFPRNQAIPAIFQVLPDGSESIVPFDVRDDFVVVHGVVRQLRLRRGKSLLCIWNDAYAAYGRDLSTGTASPDVTREIGTNQ
jgi:type IV secretion system protein VirB9